MSTPDTRVFIAFDLAAGGSGDFFTLNDPVKGELDNTTYVLAGETLIDVTEDVRAVSVRRGRSRQLEQFQAGAATVDLRNDQRKFDPAAGTAITPYGVSMRPRKQVVIEANGQRVFTGVVDDWNLEYSLDNDHRAVVSAVDGFVFLATQLLEEFTATPQTTGERIEAVLARPEITFPGVTNVQQGLATLQGDTVSDGSPINLLSYLQDVELAEPGALFMDKADVLTFRQRTDLQQPTTVSFADNGTGIPFVGISTAYGSEELRNRAIVSRLNGGTVTAVDAASVTDYGPIDLSLTDLLLADDTQAQTLADWLVNVYGQPQLRVDRLEVNLAGLDLAQTGQVLGLELGDVVSVRFTPSGIGDPIIATASIDSIEHSVRPAEHIVRFDLSQTIAAFVLDSQFFGVLDQNNLGF